MTNIEARIEALETEVRQLRDEADIADVLVRYSRSLDWLDDEMLDTVFYDDAEIDYGFFRGSGKEFKPLLLELEHSVGRRWHFTSQLKIDLHGDEADVESYNFAVSSYQVGSIPPGNLDQFFGYYLDRLVRRDGKWGIIRRKHLLIGTLSAKEIPLDGPFAELNHIGVTSPAHPDFRRLSEAPALDRKET